jgi:hypothetical protein
MVALVEMDQEDMGNALPFNMGGWVVAEVKIIELKEQMFFS